MPMNYLSEASLIDSSPQARYKLPEDTTAETTLPSGTNAVLVIPGTEMMNGVACDPSDIDQITGFDADGDPVHYFVAFAGFRDGLVPTIDADAALWWIEETTYPHPTDEYARHGASDTGPPPQNR